MIETGPIGRLIKLESRSGLLLDGILYSNENLQNDTLILHVHGALGNFYSNEFLWKFAEATAGEAIDFLPFNLACHDGIAEGYRSDEEFFYVGGSVSRFESCLDDIAGALLFGRSRYRHVFLQGHSMGCDRIVAYLLDNPGIDVAGASLLSPCDSYQLHMNWLDDETPEQQAPRIRACIPREDSYWALLPETEYGLRQGDWTYPIPVTPKAFLSILEGPPFNLFRMSNPNDFHISVPCFAYIGGSDHLQTAPPGQMLQYLRSRVENLNALQLPEGGHSLESCDETVATAVAQWARSVASNRSATSLE